MNFETISILFKMYALFFEDFAFFAVIGLIFIIIAFGAFKNGCKFLASAFLAFGLVFHSDFIETAFAYFF